MARVIYILIAALLAAPAGAKGAHRSEILVSAAVSLTGSLQRLKSTYEQQHPGVSIALNLGASGILEQQIEEGAPVDIFISASPDEMNELERKGLLLTRTRRNLLRNVLVLISPRNAHEVSSFRDLERPAVRRIAMANPESVPAGRYALETLKYFKIYRAVEPKIVRAGDVRQALAYVETGDADAGLVYLTEAKLSSKVRVAAAAPPDSHEPIIYPIAVLSHSRHAELAKKFAAFLESVEAQRVFMREGFEPAAN